MIEQKYINSLLEFDRTLTARDVRVGTFSVIIAQHCPALKEMYPQLNPMELYSAIYASGCLHDIGKTLYAQQLLSIDEYPNSLDTEDMQSHPKRAVEILNSDPDFQSQPPAYRQIVENGCLYHHERYDGMGYPRGLSGKSVPLEAQIVSMGDTLDTLLATRFYKPHWTMDNAEKYILSCENTTYSPYLIKCFLDEKPELASRFVPD
jgi:putative two-component system response regulator